MSMFFCIPYETPLRSPVRNPFTKPLNTCTKPFTNSFNETLVRIPKSWRHPETLRWRAPARSFALGLRKGVR